MQAESASPHPFELRHESNKAKMNRGEEISSSGETKGEPNHYRQKGGPKEKDGRENNGMRGVHGVGLAVKGTLRDG